MNSSEEWSLGASWGESSTFGMNRPISHNSNPVRCYNLQFAILLSRGEPRLYLEVVLCLKLCNLLLLLR